MKREPWHISDEDEQLLKEMVTAARSKCPHHSDVFINHAGFDPRLKREYANLVRAYTTKARQAGAKIHDGQAFLKDVKLRDHMHFHEASTKAVVDCIEQTAPSPRRLRAREKRRERYEPRLKPAHCLFVSLIGHRLPHHR